MLILKHGLFHAGWLGGVEPPTPAFSATAGIDRGQATITHVPIAPLFLFNVIVANTVPNQSIVKETVRLVENVGRPNGPAIMMAVSAGYSKLIMQMTAQVICVVLGGGKGVGQATVSVVIVTTELVVASVTNPITIFGGIAIGTFPSLTSGPPYPMIIISRGKASL